ncbi:FAD-dependent oxidoreductase [bacterium]|nr:FAD-dependent oxidoreductase [bacterium]
MTHRYIILGGGLAGLTMADELLARGNEATVLEAAPEVGGLARNIEVRGHLFDIGGHRFFSDKQEINDWFRALMEGEIVEVIRKSRILMNGRFADYPLRPVNAFFGMGPMQSLKIVLGYLNVVGRNGGPQENFEDWVVARFGRPLYDIYFGPYTEKAWGVDPTRISAEWAAQRIQLVSLTEAVRKAVLPSKDSPRTYVSRFMYPRRGIGRITQRLAERVRSRGGDIRLKHAVEAIEKRGSQYAVSAGGATFEGDRIVSTIPVPLLANFLGEPMGEGALEYRCLRCVFLLLNRPRVTDDTWIYVPDRNVTFARIHEPKNWSREMVPGDGTSLCLEVFCTEGDEIWNMPGDELHRLCVDDLARLKFIDPGDVAHAHDIRVRNAYPVFLVGYRPILDDVLRRVAAHEGVYTVGRTGSFTYTNMDQVVDQALRLTERIVGA